MLSRAKPIRRPGPRSLTAVRDTRRGLGWTTGPAALKEQGPVCRRRFWKDGEGREVREANGASANNLGPALTKHVPGLELAGCPRPAEPAARFDGAPKRPGKPEAEGVTKAAGKPVLRVQVVVRNELGLTLLLQAGAIRADIQGAITALLAGCWRDGAAANRAEV